jgi:hypothetical protein
MACLVPTVGAACPIRDRKPQLQIAHDARPEIETSTSPRRLIGDGEHACHMRGHHMPSARACGRRYGRRERGGPPKHHTRRDRGTRCGTRRRDRSPCAGHCRTSSERREPGTGHVVAVRMDVVAVGVNSGAILRAIHIPSINRSALSCWRTREIVERSHGRPSTDQARGAISSMVIGSGVLCRTVATASSIDWRLGRSRAGRYRSSDRL